MCLRKYLTNVFLSLLFWMSFVVGLWVVWVCVVGMD